MHQNLEFWTLIILFGTLVWGQNCKKFLNFSYKLHIDIKGVFKKDGGIFYPPYNPPGFAYGGRWDREQNYIFFTFYVYIEDMLMHL